MDQDESISLKPRRPTLIFFIFGLASLITYSFVYSVLPEFQVVLGLNFGSFATAGYGIAATIGQLFGVLIGRRLNGSLTVIACLIVLCLLSLFFGLLLYIQVLVDMRLAVAAMVILGFASSILQFFVSGWASSVSSGAIIAFYIGQSVSGLVPFPILWSAAKVLKELRHSIIVMATICILLCIIAVTFSRLFVDESDKSLSKNKVQPRPIFHVLFAICRIAVSILVVTLISFTVYPRELLRWSPESGSWFESVSMYQSFLIYLAICFDVVGMFMTMYGINVSIDYVPVSAALRILFIPLYWIAGCDFFTSDLLRILLVASMSLSGSVVFGSAVNGLPLDADDMAGHIVSLCFNLGIGAGGLVGHCLGKLVGSF